MKGTCASKEQMGMPGTILTGSKPDSTRRHFVQNVTFETSPQIMYESFLDENLVRAFSGAQSKVESFVGGEFTFFGGIVHGVHVELVTHKKIVQKWRYNNWPPNHFSRVSLEFASNGNGTLLTLTQHDIPASDFDRTLGGWETFFWQKLRGLFGWQYQITN